MPKPRSPEAIILLQKVERATKAGAACRRFVGEVLDALNK